MSTLNKLARISSPFELEPLVEFTRTINASFDLDFILNNILYTLMGKLRFTRGVILLRDREHTFRVAKVKGTRELKEHSVLELVAGPESQSAVHLADTEDSLWSQVLTKAGMTHIHNLTVQDRLIGVIALGKRIGNDQFTPPEEIFLRSLVNISATAIEKASILEELRKTNRELGNRIQELNTLFEMSKEFGSVIRRDQLIKVLVFSLLGHLGTNRYLIALKNKEQCEIIASRLPMKEVQQSLLRDLMECRKPELVDASLISFEDHTQQFLVDCKISAIVPLTMQGETRGVMLLGKRMGERKYTEKDLEFLSSLGNLAMMSLENIRLFEETLEKQRLEEELRLAREIQEGLLPTSLPAIPNYQIAAKTSASKHVGGDYYDVVRLDDHRYIFVVADVAGKGVPAALLMANLQATIRAIAPLEINLSEATARVNELVYDNTSANKFISMFWAILDVHSNTFKYVNAGHNFPFYLKRTGEMCRLEKGGMILGVLRPSVAYDHQVICLEKGDLIVMFTDGITEAMSSRGEEFGEQRLEQIIRQNASKDAMTILDTILHSVREFSDPANQSDDVTVVVLKAT